MSEEAFIKAMGPQAMFCTYDFKRFIYLLCSMQAFRDDKSQMHTHVLSSTESSISVATSSNVQSSSRYLLAPTST